MVEIQAMHAEFCWHSGRGPELRQVFYHRQGVQLKAINYINPDGEARHLLFVNSQVFMFKPEEVENYASSVVNWVDMDKAAIVRLRRSPWLASFNPYHLKECAHFRIMFYDEFLDVICRDIVAHAGGYSE